MHPLSYRRRVLSGRGSRSQPGEEAEVDSAFVQQCEEVTDPEAGIVGRFTANLCTQPQVPTHQCRDGRPRRRIDGVEAAALK
jgi:hypothetical protein